MPDWSYHPLFKPLLTRMPGNFGREFIHRGMSAITRVPGGKAFIEFLGHMSPSNKLSRDVFGLTFDSPLGLSGKIDPQISGIDAFPQLGFGLIEIGPVTALPCRPERAAIISELDAALVLPEQAESPGLQYTLKLLEKLGSSLTSPLMIRLDESTAYAEELKNVGDVFILELNSIQDIEDLTTLKKLVGNKPILLAVKHTEAAENLSKLKTFSKDASGIMIDEASISSDGKKIYPLQQTDGLVKAIKLLKNEIELPLLTSGGVVEPADALVLFSTGAELVLLSGGYVASGPGLPKRINEALLDTMGSAQEQVSGWIWYWMFGLLIMIGGALALFFSLTKVILFYDEAFMQMSRVELMAFNPNLYQFMSHDRMTLAGTMISGGFIYMQLAKHGVRHGIHWTRRAINLAATIGFLGILLFLGFGYFDWLHGLFWLVLTPFFILGCNKTRSAVNSPSSKNRSNHDSWKKALYGQLAFVILGFSFVTGGFVISSIGVTNVFVDTDLEYICMTTEQLNELNDKLIPVIAHDRAGFGSALFSVGLLVLMLGLWGFHEGASWVWRTFFYGGIPAFSAGIFTHMYIGYTDFIHLAPAYFALGLYLAGLILSKGFLCKPTDALIQ